MMHKGTTARTSISITAGWPRSPGWPRHRRPVIHPGRSRQAGSKIYKTCPSAPWTAAVSAAVRPATHTFTRLGEYFYNNPAFPQSTGKIVVQ